MPPTTGHEAAPESAPADAAYSQRRGRDPGHASGRSYRSRPAFAVVTATLALLMVGPNLVTPLYPLYQETFHFSPLTTTAIYGIYVGTLVPSLLLFGPLSDAIGRRRVLYGGLVFGVVGSLVLATASGTLSLALGRLLQGISVGAASGAAAAALRETEPSDDRARAATVAAAAMVGGSAAGPLLAGLLIQYGPAPRVLSYALHIALLAIIAVWLRVLHEPHRNGSWKP